MLYTAKQILLVSLLITLLSIKSAYADPFPRANDESNFSDPAVGLWFGSSIAMCSRDTTDLKLKLQHMASAANGEKRFFPERVSASAAAYRLEKLKCMQAAIRAHFSLVNGTAPNDAKLRQLKTNPEMIEIIKRLDLFGKALQNPLPYKCNQPEELEACKQAHYLRTQSDAGMGWALEKISASLSESMETRGSLSIRKLFDENRKTLEKEVTDLNQKAIALEDAVVRPQPRPPKLESDAEGIK